MGYCENMLNNVKIYTSDKYWNQILTDLGADIAQSPNVSDVIFDDIEINAPISVPDLKNAILDYMNCTDVIRRVFGREVILPTLQHKIVVLIHKNVGLTMSELKAALGFAPDVTSHAVENAIYQLRKTYGREFIQNVNGKYKIGRL